MKYYTLPEYKYEYEQPMLNHEAFGSAAGGPRLKPMALLSREGNTTACVTPLESGELWGWALGVWRWVMKQSFLPIRALTPLLQIWDTQTGVKLFKDILVGIAPGDWPIDAAISRNGQVIATLSERGLVTIVDINEKEPVHLGALEHLHHITVDQSEDNIIVFALSEDTLLQFDPASLEFEVLWTSVSKTRLTTFCILPDLQHVLIGDNNGRFVILDISKDRSPQTLATWQAHKGSVRSCVVDINGRICVSAGDDLLIRMWDLQDQNEISKAPIEAPIASLAFWEKGGIIGATDQTHRFYAWQLKEFSFTGNE
jgi:WD40 repeat protein